jgi:hypothetical protein
MMSKVYGKCSISINLQSIYTWHGFEDVLVPLETPNPTRIP